MTSHTQHRPPVTARTAGAILLTALLVTAPLTASASDTSSAADRASVPAAASASAPAPELGGNPGTTPELGGNPSTAPELGGSPGTAPELGSSQEGSWFLGRSVDSVLGPGQWYTTEAGRTWYGAYRTFDDEYAYCVDAGLKTPHPRFFSDTDDGEPVEAATTAWALSTHGRSDSAPVHAALSALVRLDDSIPHRHAIEPGHPADLGAEFAEAAAETATIDEDASRFAGPYTLTVDIRVRVLQAYDGQYGPPLETVAAAETPPLLRGFPLEAVVSLTSASGHEMTGHRVRLSATGARPGEDTVVVGDEPTVVSLTDLADGLITVEAVAADLPATSVILHRPRGLGSDRVQAVVTAGEPTTVTGQAVYDRGPDPDEDQEMPDAPEPTPKAPSPDGPAPEDPETEGSSPDEPAPEGPTPDGPTPHVPSPERLDPDGPDESDDTDESDETGPEEADGPRVEVPMPRPTTLPLPSGSPDRPESSEAPDDAGGTTESAAPPTPTWTAVPLPQRTADAPGGAQTPGDADPQEPPTSPAPRPPGQDEDAVPVSLPRTGTNPTMAVGLAITLVAVGVGALTLTRRR